MQTRTIGTLEVSEIGLGCMGMSGTYGDRDEAGGMETIHRALNLGMNFIDTADIYGNGHNEELVGAALRGRRGEAVLATKFGNVAGKDGHLEVRGDPAYVAQACDRSLQRLGIETIDLYYLHRVDRKVRIEDTIGAMKKLVDQGKIRHIGLSEASATTIRRAHDVHPVTALQSEYSLWTRDVENEILPTCRELGIGLVPYSPLGRGFLTGTLGDIDALPEGDRRRVHPRFLEENIKKNEHMVETLRAISGGLGCTPAQLALAWVLAKGDDIVPIPGTKKVKWLEENIAAAGIRLPAETLAQLDAAFAPGKTAGDRYPKADMEKINL